MGLDNDHDPRFCPECGSRLTRYASHFSDSQDQYRRYKRCSRCDTTHVSAERLLPRRVNRTPTPS